MDTIKLYKRLARDFDAYLNCIKSGNAEWKERWQDDIEQACDNYLPSGSGFDSGTTFDFDASRKDRLVFHTSYHHMDESGYYDGWSEHDIVITPSLAMDFDIVVKGRNRNEIKDYIGELMVGALWQDVPEWEK